MKLKTFEYAYDATPSVYYHMRSSTKHEGANYIIDHQIEKKGAGESQIILTVWVDTRSTISPFRRYEECCGTNPQVIESIITGRCTAAPL